MFKKTVFAGLGIALLVSPLLVSADTLSDLQAQIQNLLAQVRQLQAQLAQLQGTNPADDDGRGVGIVVPPSLYPVDPVSICPALHRALTFGAQGDDVVQLQKFLANQGIFTGGVTGFFGTQTQAAVQAWQARNDIVSFGDPSTTGWGAIGPTTRGWIARWCGGNSSNEFSASPTSGAAPLTVGFMGSIKAQNYSLDFGDGSPVVGVVNQVECFREGDVIACPQPDNNMKVSQTHTYTANGTYTAKLTYQPPMPQCSSDLACAQVMPAEVVRTLTISVGTQTSNVAFSASPTSGVSPLAVTFSVRPAPSTDTAKGYSVDFGDGTTGPVAITGQRQCFAAPCESNIYGANHTYTSDGTYVAKLMYQEPFVCNAPPGAACAQVMANPKQVGTVVIHVGTQTNTTTFSASPTSGTAPLAVTFTRIVNTNGEQPACEGSAYVDFGDGTSRDVSRCGSFTVTHTYPSSGTYSAQFKYGCGGAPATCVHTTVGTATIQVGGTTSTGVPSVTGVDGPASLATGQSGTWTVRASVPNNPNAQLRYSVIWGDEGILSTLNAFAGTAAPTLQTSASFTHVYARAGTYRPTFTVSNDAGSAQTSASVVVGKETTSLNCPQYMPPLCSSNETLVGGGYRSDGCQLGPRCVSKTSTSDTFSASPTSGAVPLTTMFSVGLTSFTGIDFGDGQNVQAPLFGMCTSSPCWTTSHTYTSSGTYAAKLINGYNAGQAQYVGAVTIQVGGGASSGGICPTGSFAAAFGSCTTYVPPVQTNLWSCPAGTSAGVAFGSCTSNTYTSPTLNSCPTGTHWVGGTSIGCVRDTQSSSAQSSQLASALTALESAIRAFIADLR